MATTNLRVTSRMAKPLAALVVGGLLAASVISSPAAIAAPASTDVAASATPTAALTAERAATLQIYKDRDAINKGYVKFMKLTFDPNRVADTADELAGVGFPLDGDTEAKFNAQATALIKVISSKTYVGTPAEKIITRYYGSASAIGRTDARTPADAAAFAFFIGLTTANDSTWPLPKASLFTWKNFAVNGNKATIYGQDIVNAKAVGIDPNLPIAKFTKVNGKWIMEFDAEGTSKAPKKITTTITKWKSGKAKVRKGKTLKSRTVTVKSATGKVVLQKKAAGAKKWSKVRSFTVNAKTGVATVKFPKATKAGKVAYRVTYDGGAYYKAKTSKTLTVTVK